MALQVFFRISLWTITIIQYSVFYWTFNDDVLHSAIFFSILYLIGCPCCSLIGYWFGHTERQLNASLSRDMPTQLDDITPLTVNPVCDHNVSHNALFSEFPGISGNSSQIFIVGML